MSDDAVWLPTTALSVLPVVDRLETEGGTVVMVESGAAHRIVRLSGLGVEVLAAVDGGTTLGALEAAMLERLGPPPDGDLSRAVQAAVKGLVDAGLLSVA
ncbi:PqqD family peptide modification chaperone [Humibacillus xanthopallidus]|uniref:PqqD family peptide modification chaperone n=1 Tax=Humibacillus xanthopallidus TaxID=412689 RepID=UPI00115439EE|nr:PqqD family peptide modification chaperone [Humibacillus xanthopallidus]